MLASDHAQKWSDLHQIWKPKQKETQKHRFETR